MEVLSLGILLTGVSGIGKSEIALSLIDRGHSLIADDSVIFTMNAPDTIIGHCSPVIQDFLEVRGLGILNIRALFGDTAIKKKKELQLIVNFITLTRDELHFVDRFNGMNRTQDILGCQIPEVSIPVAPGRNLSILVEAAVKNQLLKANGYNSSEEFYHRQLNFIDRETSNGS